MTAKRAVCWAVLALTLVLCAAPARAQGPEAPREVATCGGCRWLVVGGSPGTLIKNGTCEADCPPSSGSLRELSLYDKEIGLISEGAFQGLPQLTHLYLGGNGIQMIPEDAFLDLPQLQGLYLDNTPLAGLAPTILRNKTALIMVSVGNTALGCVPAGGIPDTAYIYGAVRCPADCEVGTVYDAAAGACVACPAGLHTVAPPGTVGGTLATCVPAGWDAVLLGGCGSCAFWRTLEPHNVLVRTGSCEADCSGMGGLHLAMKDIASVAPGVFANLTRLPTLLIYANGLGCVPGVPHSVQIDPYSDTWPQTPRCPANCVIGTFFDRMAGVCRACPDGLTTAGVGGGGNESCVDPAALVRDVEIPTSTPPPLQSPAPAPQDRCTREAVRRAYEEAHGLSKEESAVCSWKSAGFYQEYSSTHGCRYLAGAEYLCAKSETK